MNGKDIRELLEYRSWAKERLLGSLESVKQEDFEKDLHSSHGGIRGTLFHIMSAENTWTRRLAGESAMPLDESMLKSLDDFKSEWNRIDMRLSSLVDGLTDEQLHVRFDYQDMKGNKYSHPRIWALQQVFNHFTYHRGQIVTMQRQLGYKPANTDMIGFFREKDSRQ
jgi:uncharacterized damage-inducible protein DinB